MRDAVFVSSTFVDLVKHRDAVQRIVRQAGLVDVAMENFGARDERPKQECLRIIAEECDLFVGIYAHRYGFIPKGASKSITESEYDAASERKLPRFIYLVNEDTPWSPRFIDPEPAAGQLRRFTARLREELVCKPFSTPDDLAASVAADLGRHLLKAALVRVGPTPSVGQPSSRGQGDWSPQEWNDHRDHRYEKNRRLFLVHTISPSRVPGQLFDVSIYLQRHKSTSLADVRSAEFFLGPSWHSQVFTVQNTGRVIGISTAAFGEFLCVCRVRFVDGNDAYLERYINFGEYASQATQTPEQPSEQLPEQPPEQA